ncbi:MAG: ParB/RepB/Spo0J family partition protein [Planctomycetota bacterium]|nr:ParB/RepB/Spo0J family partition protein [Planctomycetota bacterium]
MAGLGRGLDSLIAQDTEGSGGVSQREISIAQIRPNPMQPRKVFESAHLEDLRNSIENHGILQPICVRKVEGGYEIISGERRWRAARLAGLRTMPVVIREDVSNNEMMELALVENLQRQDLDPIEKAQGFAEMVESLGLTQEQVAAKVGLKRSTVTNHLRLLELDEEVQEALVSGLITMGHARALLAVAGDSKEKKKALATIVRDELSVRQTERLVKGASASPATSSDSPVTASSGESVERPEAWVQDLERRMREHLGVRVDLAVRKGYKGQISLHFSGRDELEALVEGLAPKKTI